MKQADVRAWAQRGWRVAERAKQEYWVERFRSQGAAGTAPVVWAMHDHFHLLRAGRPDDDARERDLAHHLELRAAFDRTADVIARR